MPRYGMIAETDRCLGCDICLKACKDEFTGNDYAPYSAAQPEVSYGYGADRTFGWPSTPSQVIEWTSHGHLWMRVEERLWGTYPRLQVRYLPLPCMHCSSAPCIDAALDGAVFRRPDGIVLIDPEKSRGQRQLVDACPYGRIEWNDEKGIPQKCTFCVHLLDQGGTPRCVEACPFSVLTFGDLDDPQSDVSLKLKALDARPLNPEYKTQPCVHYAGLPAP